MNCPKICHANINKYFIDSLKFLTHGIKEWDFLIIKKPLRTEGLYFKYN
jgi:hypothetical protein